MFAKLKDSESVGIFYYYFLFLGIEEILGIQNEEQKNTCKDMFLIYWNILFGNTADSHYI